MTKIALLLGLLACASAPPVNKDVLGAQPMPADPRGVIFICPKATHVQAHFVPPTDTSYEHLILWCGRVHNPNFPR